MSTAGTFTFDLLAGINWMLYGLLESLCTFPQLMVEGLEHAVP